MTDKKDSSSGDLMIVGLIEFLHSSFTFLLPKTESTSNRYPPWHRQGLGVEVVCGFERIPRICSFGPQGA